MTCSWICLIIVLNASLTLLGSILTLILILIRHKQQKKTISISLLLIIIMLLSKAFLSVALIILLTSTTSNHFTFVCRLKGYFGIVTNASLYCSFCLQSFYGLCRVRFSKNRTVSLSRRFYIYTAVLILLLLCLCNLPFLFVDGWIEYSVDANICFVSGQHLYPLIYFSLTMCFLPVFISTCYFWTLLYIHHHNDATNNNNNQIASQREKRNIIVLKRISLLIVTLILPSLPTIALLIQFFTAGDDGTMRVFLPSLLAGSTALASSTLTSFYTRPELKNLVSRSSRTQPIVIALVRQQQQQQQQQP
jgi:hypothetical protein